MVTDTPAQKPKGRTLKRAATIIAGAALFFSGGTTLAEWQDEVTSARTTISFGDFALEQTGYSVSINGEAVDPETDKAAPGDTVLLSYDYQVASDALSVVELAADYAHRLSFAGGPSRAEVESWITIDVTGDTVVHQDVEGAPYKVTLTDGEATFTAKAAMEVPDDLNNSWENGAITYEGTMYVSQGDTVEADHDVHEVASANAITTALGASTWDVLAEGAAVRLGQHSDGTVQIVRRYEEPPYYDEVWVDDATIADLIDDGYFTAID